MKTCEGFLRARCILAPGHAGAHTNDIDGDWIEVEPPPMATDEYQRQALRTEKTPMFINPDVMHGATQHERITNAIMLSRVTHGVLGVVTEIGEAADILKRHLVYGAPFDSVHIMEEAGDKAWYIALILDAAGYPMSHALGCNVAKLKARYPQGFTEEKALARDLEAERRALEARTAGLPADLEPVQVHTCMFEYEGAGFHACVICGKVRS